MGFETSSGVWYLNSNNVELGRKTVFSLYTFWIYVHLIIFKVQEYTISNYRNKL